MGRAAPVHAPFYAASFEADEWSTAKRILGVRVVRTDGSRLGLLRTVGRTLLVCLVIPAVVMDQQGRGLAVAGSLVPPPQLHDAVPGGLGFR